jgi:hypothetical protein
MTSGPHDAVASVEASDLDALGYINVHEVRSLPEVSDAITRLAVDPAR